MCHTYSKFEHDPCIKEASLSETAKWTWKSTTSTIRLLQLEILHLFQIERCIAPPQMSIFQPDLIGLSHCFHYNKMHPKIIKKNLYVFSWFWMEVKLPSLGGVHLRKITFHLLLFSPGWSNILNDLTQKTPPPPIPKNMLLKNWISFPLGNLERKPPTTQPPNRPTAPKLEAASVLPKLGTQSWISPTCGRWIHPMAPAPRCPGPQKLNSYSNHWFSGPKFR